MRLKKKALQRRRMEEKDQERWDIWLRTNYFSHPCLSVWDMQQNSEEKRGYGRTCQISQVERTFAVYLSRLQCGETQFFIWILIERISFNWNNFRLQHRNMQCKSMWSPITRPQRRNQQTYKFLACSKFQWIGVRWISSQQKNFVWIIVICTKTRSEKECVWVSV